MQFRNDMCKLLYVKISNRCDSVAVSFKWSISSYFNGRMTFLSYYRLKLIYLSYMEFLMRFFSLIWLQHLSSKLSLFPKNIIGLVAGTLKCSISSIYGDELGFFPTSWKKEISLIWNCWNNVFISTQLWNQLFEQIKILHKKW